MIDFLYDIRLYMQILFAYNSADENVSEFGNSCVTLYHMFLRVEWEEGWRVRGSVLSPEFEFLPIKQSPLTCAHMCELNDVQ